MSEYKIVEAKKRGTIALSGGISHFNPKNAREGGRYMKAILLAEDAAKAERKGLVEIVGDATEADHIGWVAQIRENAGAAGSSQVHEFAAPAVDHRTDDANKRPAKNEKGPAGKQAVQANAGDGQGEQGLPQILNQGVKKLPEALAAVSSLEELMELYRVEAGREAPRATALEAIEIRANQIDNAKFDAFKAELEAGESQQPNPDAPPA